MKHATVCELVLVHIRFSRFPGSRAAGIRHDVSRAHMSVIEIFRIETPPLLFPL